MSYSFADSSRAGSERNSVLILVVSSRQTCMTNTIEILLMVDRGTVRNMFFYSKNKFEKLVHLKNKGKLFPLQARCSPENG